MKSRRIVSTALMIFLVICIHSCRDKESDNARLVTIDVAALFDERVEAPLSAIGDLFKVVPLETNEESIISGNPSRVIFANGNYYVDSKKLIYRFSENGEFLNPIGKVGRGPGEYSSLGSYDVSDCGSFVAVLSSRRALLYNIEGDFIRSFPVDNKAREIAITSDAVVTHSDHDHEAAEHSFCIYTLEGTPLKCFPAFEKFIEPERMVQVLQNSAFFFKYANNLYVKEYVGDTIYMFSGIKLEPRLVLSTTTYRLTPEKRSVINGFTEVLSTSWMFETGNYLLARFSLHKTGLLILHNNLTSEIIALNPTGGISDNLVSNTNIFNFYQSEADSCVMFMISAPDYLSYPGREGMATGTNDSIPSRIDESSNPVIVKFRLKDKIVL